MFFRVLLRTYKAGLSPDYVEDLLRYYDSRRTLRSSNKTELLDEPWENLKTYGERAFSIAAPMLWNKLQLQIRFSSSEAVLEANLKTYLFKHAFDLYVLFVILLYYIAHLIRRILTFRFLEYCKAPWTIDGRWRYINVYLFIIYECWQIGWVFGPLIENAHLKILSSSIAKSRPFFHQHESFSLTICGADLSSIWGRYSF